MDLLHKVATSVFTDRFETVMEEVNVLCIGLVCIDHIFEIPFYPKEDSKLRCNSHWVQRGGNASNNSTVLGSLGANTYYLGTITDGTEKNFIEKDFKDYGVNCSLSVTIEGSTCPTSNILLSAATASRTVIHSNPNMNEISLQDFLSIDICNFDWIHFEGRNTLEVKEMMNHVHHTNKIRENQIIVSVEIEKARPVFKELIALGDYIFISRDFALSRDWTSIEETLENVSKIATKSATVICPWGHKGAGAKTGENAIVYGYPFTPNEIVNTVGAGDTFIASTLYALASGETVEHSINFGCKVAGYKIGLKKWSEFRDTILNQDFVKRIKENLK